LIPSTEEFPSSRNPDFILVAKPWFAGLAIAVSGAKITAVEQARDHIVAAHSRKNAGCVHNFWRQCYSTDHAVGAAGAIWCEYHLSNARRE
jgi:hypothetical protein